MEPIEKLLSTGRYSRQDLGTIYRFLCKNTHPDIAGGNGDAFLRVKEAYRNALLKFENITMAKSSPENFDPNEISRLIDYPGPRTPRNLLFACLRFYFILGLQSYRVRTLSSLRKRNQRVLRSILYWAEIYDRGFVDIFLDFNRQVILPLSSTRDMKRHTAAKKAFFSGIDWFFQFQETRRDSCRRIAVEKLTAAVSLFDKCSLSQQATRRFAAWLLREIEKSLY